MPICPNCEYEYIEGISICPDCNVALVDELKNFSELSEDEFAKLQNDLEKELKEKGKIFITKDSGLFEAMK